MLSYHRLGRFEVWSDLKYKTYDRSLICLSPRTRDGDSKRLQLPAEIPFRVPLAAGGGRERDFAGRTSIEETWNVSRANQTCSLTNATVPATSSTAAHQHGGHDEREAVEKVSKVRDTPNDTVIPAGHFRPWPRPFSQRAIVSLPPDIT